MNLKIRIALLTLLSALAVGLGSAAWTSFKLHDVLLQDLADRGDSIVRALAETMVTYLVEREQVSVIHGLRRLQAGSDDIAYVYVTDFDGTLFGHSFKGGFPAELEATLSDAAEGAPGTQSERRFAGRPILEVTRPLVGSMAARVTIGLETSLAQRQIRETAGLVLAVSLLIGAVVALLGIYFARRLAQPIEVLADKMSRYGRGETVSSELLGRYSGSYEIGLLAQRFAEMIRERQRSEAELNQIKHTLDNTNDAVFMFYPDTLKFFYANRGALRQIGYNRNELLQMTPLDIKPNYDEPGFRALIQPLLAGDRESITFETVHQHKSGRPVPVEIFLQYMADGEPPHFLAMVRDISERKQAEAELGQIKETLDNTLDAVFMFAPDTLRFSYVNRGALQQTGYGSDELLHMTPLAIQPEYDEAGFRDLLRPLLTGTQDSLTFETVQRHKSGHDIPVEVFLQYMAHGEPPHFLAMVRDISERKRAEAALQASDLRLRSVVTAAPLVLWSWDRNGVFTLSEGSGLQGLGLQPGQVVGQSVFDVYSEVPELISAAKRALAGEGFVEQTAVGGHVWQAHYQPWRDDRGQLLGTIGVALDITERQQTERQLLEERNFSNAVLDNAGALIVVLDHDGRIEQFNRACERLTGYRFDEVQGKLVWDVLVPEDEREQVRTQAFEVLTRERATAAGSYVNNWLTRMGEQRLIEWNNSVLLDDGGQIGHIVSIGIDITERQRAETARERREHLIMQVAESTSRGADADFLQQLTQTLAEALGVDWAFIGECHPIPRPRVTTLSVFGNGERRPNFEYELSGTPCERVLQGEDCVYPRGVYEQFPGDPDLSAMGIEAYIGSPVTDSQGRLMGVLAVLHGRPMEDTELVHQVVRIFASRAGSELERQQQQQVLQESEALLREAQELAHLGNWNLDLNTGKAIWSDEEFRLLGYEPGSTEPSVDNFMQAVHPDDRATVQAEMQRAMDPAETRPYHSEHRVSLADGERMLEQRGRVSFDAEGRPVRMFGTTMDITERKHAERALQRLNDELEQRVSERTAQLADSNAQLRDALQTLQLAQDELVRSEKLASLGSLVAGIAHELNTPLGNSVTVSTTLQEWLRDFRRELQAETLRRSTLDEFVQQAEQATQLLVRNLARAAELIADFKQVAVDQTSAQRREFDLQRVVTEIVETLQPQFKKTPHRIRVDIAEGIHLDSFPGPLGQVVTNLALNALVHGFTDDMRGEVQISVRECADDRIELLVRDNGEGIPAEYLTKVFDPFFTTRMGQGGSGLGLHIAYTLVTRILGGSIMIESPPEGGTRAVIQLPRSAPRPAQDDSPGQ